MTIGWLQREAGAIREKKRKCVIRGCFTERASEEEREDAEEEMKRRLGGKKRNSLFPL